jgi:hypothetical protein
VPRSAGRRNKAFGEAGGVLQKQFQEVFFGRCFREQELVAAGAGDDFPGGREEPVSPAFDVPGFGAVAVREGGELEPGHQVESEGCDVGPSLVRGEVEGSLPRPVFFRVLIRFSHLPRARCLASRNGPCQRGEFVRNAVIRCPSISSRVGCAPGCSGSERRNSFVPGG